MIVLVDTSVWVEYFRKRSRLSASQVAKLDTLIGDDLAAIVQPVRAELLSGEVKKARDGEVRRALSALRSIDLDWNAPETWDAVARCAQEARRAGLPSVSIVDRMVLLATEAAGAAMWTLDEPLAKLAAGRGTPVVA